MAGSVSYNGINHVIFGLLDNTGAIISDPVKGIGANGILLVDGDGQGATTANITGLEAAGTIQYANNKAKRTTHGAQAPQVALTMLDMPFDVLQKLKGYVSDGKGGYVLSSGKKPHVAMLICSTGFDGENYYDAFANGELVEPGKNHGTNTASEVEYNATLTYQALAPIKDDVFLDDRGNQQPYKQYASIDSGFTEAAMLKEVFGGYTDPDAVSVTSVSLDKTTLSGKVGGTGSLTATVAPTNATNKQVTFASSDTSVATIDNSGSYAFVKSGSATFTATTSDGSKTATCSVTVSAA